MKKLRKPRIKVTERCDQKSRKYFYERRKYLLKLSKTEIGILKAALQYYVMDDDFSYYIWYIGGAGVGSSDRRYRRIVCGTSFADGLFDELNHLSRVKPSFYWGNIAQVGKLLQKEIDEYEKEAKKLVEKYGMPQLQLAGRSEEELKEIEESHSKWKKQQKQNKKKNNNG